ncbi:MAG: PEP-CTERM sorting domain-containing protein [Verrucomicrobiota bacterium]
MKKTIGMAMLVALVSAGVASAAVITSTDFSIGLGKTSGTGAWTTTETASVNTDVTGPFTLSVAASCSSFYGSSGTTFQNRVLGMGLTGVQYVGKVQTFDTLTVAANYTGGLAGNSATPMTLVIDSVRIWASNGVQNNYVYWLETTPGNAAQQANQSLGAAASYTVLADYQNVVWNPGEQAVAGTSSTRTFDLNGASVHEIRIDGIEVLGHVEYDAIPEPATLSLFGLIGGGLLWIRRKSMI